MALLFAMRTVSRSWTSSTSKCFYRQSTQEDFESPKVWHIDSARSIRNHMSRL